MLGRFQIVYILFLIRPLQMGIWFPFLASCILHVGGAAITIIHYYESHYEHNEYNYPTTVHVHTRRAWTASPCSATTS